MKFLFFFARNQFEHGNFIERNEPSFEIFIAKVA